MADLLSARSKPTKKRVTSVQSYRARGPSAPVRDSSREALTTCQRRHSLVQSTWRRLAPLIPAELRANRAFVAHDRAVTRRSLSGLDAPAMSPTMWGVLGVTVGAAVMWGWLTLR